ncbi:hypothetical protein L1987_85769 [Smallanthus sonchifolius]|uniref:Uncharacterized protein n=1 Tax=Smallanthus sonchifolius TaxID=185202 RepID=A0ACB8XXW4_9ASTR|nr:hypothetical protein L1987_85769 [Smallanthus sonchifolius]
MLSVRTRSSPKSLSDATRNLSGEQKDCVRAMGFEKMLSFNVDGIPGLLGHYVVDNLDTKSMTVKLERCSIKITKEVIHQLIGVPLGGTKIVIEGRAKTRVEARKMCSAKYGLIGAPSYIQVYKSVRKIGSEMILLLLYVESTKCIGLQVQSTKIKIAQSIKCNGLQVQSTKIKIDQWTFEMLKKRQKMELECGGFGKGKTQDVFKEHEAQEGISSAETTKRGRQDTQRTIKTDTLNDIETPQESRQAPHKQSRADTLKDIETPQEKDKTPQEQSRADTLKGYVLILDNLLTSLSNNKKDFEKTIKDAFGKHPNDLELNILSDKYDKLFRSSANISNENDLLNNDKSMNDGIHDNTSKGKELVATQTLDESQLWNDPTTIDLIIKSADNECNVFYGHKGCTTSFTPPPFSLGMTQIEGLMEGINIVAYQIAFESLEPKYMVSRGVIESWSTVLNHDEAKRSKDSPYQLFSGACFFGLQQPV